MQYLCPVHVTRLPVVSRANANSHSANENEAESVQPAPVKAPPRYLVPRHRVRHQPVLTLATKNIYGSPIVHKVKLLLARAVFVYFPLVR